jgi:hypothetical protein
MYPKTMYEMDDTELAALITYESSILQDAKDILEERRYTARSRNSRPCDLPRLAAEQVSSATLNH